MIYLHEQPDDSITARVVREWNSGQRLSDAYHYLNERYGYTAKQVIITWKQLMRQWGYKPVTVHPSLIKKWDEQHDSEGYTDWKGTTGPGQELRKIIEKCINKKEP